MQRETPDFPAATHVGGVRGWTVRVVRGRLIRQRRLLLLVLAVAVLASTAVTSVGLLVAATEQSAIRTSLRSLPASATAMSVDVEQPTVSLGAVTTRVDRIIQGVIGSSATTTHAVRAYSAPYPVPVAGLQELTYFGELAGVAARVKLVAGVLPKALPTAGTVNVALPESAATQLGLGVGDTFAYAGGKKPVTVRIVGIYDVRDTTAEFWSQDPLVGAGFSTDYFLPDGSDPLPSDAFGPLIVAPGSMDAVGVPPDRVNIDYAPDFSRVSGNQLGGLIERLDNASSNVPSDGGSVAQQVEFTGNASVPLGQITAALVVTRSTVVVITLLLLVLAIAALAQAARLFNDARAGDRELMRARGASRLQLLGVTALEASVVGVVTAAVSAPLARLVYLVVAAQPALVSAKVPADAGIPGDTWLTSIGLGLLFVVVLIGSALGRGGSFVAAEQAKSRQRRVSGILRSGLDLGVVLLAVVAFWQLSIYRSPVGTTSTLSVDPVLVVAPALVLLAGSLLAARLFPLLARIVDGLGSRSSSVLFRLASWEIGRRSSRATAVVLLLTLALAVGTFSQTFLATWRQSQVDQATYAVGPPVRVPAVPNEGGAQRSLLSAGVTGTPQPVIRRVADVATDGVNGEDTNAVVLGETASARALVDRGRLADDGGSVVARKLKSDTNASVGILLPGDPSGVSAIVQLGDASSPLAGVGADVRAIIEDGAGLLTTVDLGDIPVDGAPHEVSGMLPTLSRGARQAVPLKFVGVQADVDLANQATYKPNIPLSTRFLFGRLAALDTTASGSVKTHLAPSAASVAWNAGSTDPEDSPARAITVKGWQLALAVDIPSDVQSNPGSFSATGWTTVGAVPAMISSALAKTLDVKTGTDLVLNFSRTSVEISVVGTTPLIPGAVDSSQLTASSAAGAASASAGAVVVDQRTLERALVDNGEVGSFVDEWWVDVPAADARAYLDAHRAPSGTDAATSSAVLALQMQQDPLRVATQAALWLAIGAAALLAAIGFAVHSASTLAARRIELAQLRAIGLSRGRLVGLISAESLLLCALGVLFGLVVGIVLGVLAGPLIALSPSGTPAVPPVQVIVPWLQLLALVLVIVVVLVAVVLAVARGQRSANPANILREADNG